MVDISDINLDEWMKEKNSLLSENGVTLNRVSQGTVPGTYDLEVAVNNLDVVRSLEDGYEKYKEYVGEEVHTHPDSSDDLKKLIKRGNHATASLKYRDDLFRGDLDILGGFDPRRSKPQDIYKKSIDLYHSKGIYGTVVNVICNFSSKGFRNDIDDPDIKEFFDVWGYSVGMPNFVEQLIFDLTRVGTANTYKVLGRYIPSINYHSPTRGEHVEFSSLHSSIRGVYQEYGYFEGNRDNMQKIDDRINLLLNRLPREHSARKIRWAKDFLPVGYTILNPTKIERKGSLMFGGQVVTLQIDDELKNYMEIPDSDLSEEQRRLRRLLPVEFKKAAKEGASEVPLNPYLVGQVDYRRQPYERYAMPRGLRAFDSISLKEALCSADMSTVDGINNYILKVTVGSDAHPVTDFAQLDAVAEIFNTAQKAFTVFWNHTLDITKITFPEIKDILGAEKYQQVEMDITGALGIVRALVDGGATTGSNRASIELATKSLIEEVNYIRRVVERWIYAEYRDIAEGMGFDRFPEVRWDENALKDELRMMSVVQGMVDRRMMSYESGIELLGFNPGRIMNELTNERPRVEAGDFGVLGSPYQKSSNSDNPTSGNKAVQPVQRTPTGTPSEGRPLSGSGKPREKENAVTILINDVDGEEKVTGIISKGSFKEVANDESVEEKESNSYCILVEGSEDFERFQSASEEEAMKKAQVAALTNENKNISLYRAIGKKGRNLVYEHQKTIVAGKDVGG